MPTALRFLLQLEGGAIGERPLLDDCEIILDGYALEHGAHLECAPANSFEVFVKEDALEGGAMGENPRFDDFEIIGESDTREGEALLECPRSYVRNVAVLTEYYLREMATRPNVSAGMLSSLGNPER